MLSKFGFISVAAALAVLPNAKVVDTVASGCISSDVLTSGVAKLPLGASGTPQSFDSSGLEPGCCSPSLLFPDTESFTSATFTSTFHTTALQMNNGGGYNALDPIPHRPESYSVRAC